MSIKRRTTLVGGSVAAAAALAVLAAAPANADTGYAAVAYSPATGAWGLQKGMPSAAEAIGVAMDLCRKEGGTDCQLAEQSTYHHTCVALVVATDGGWAGGRSVDTAGAIKAATRTDVRNDIAGCGGTAGQAGGMSGVYPLQPTAPSNTATVTGDVDVYDAPGGVGNVVGVLRTGQQVQLAETCRTDNWCQVSGQGWVWGDFLKR